VDRKRPKKGSNEDWVNPNDADAQIMKMTDGRTHLAHKQDESPCRSTRSLPTRAITATKY
jgi:hypothetical protein